MLSQAHTSQTSPPTASSDRCRTWPLVRPRGSLGGASGFWRLSTPASRHFARSLHPIAPVIDNPHKPQTLGLRPARRSADHCTKRDTKRAQARRGEKRVIWGRSLRVAALVGDPIGRAADEAQPVTDAEAAG